MLADRHVPSAYLNLPPLTHSAIAHWTVKMCFVALGCIADALFSSKAPLTLGSQLQHDETPPENVQPNVPPTLPGSTCVAPGSSSTADLRALAWHPATDGVMKPIVGNRRIEVLPPPTYDAALLAFAPLTATELLTGPVPARDRMLSHLRRILSSLQPPTVFLAVLRYLQTLCVDANAVHLLLFSDIGGPVLSLATNAASPLAVRSEAILLFGLLLRHASQLPDMLLAGGKAAAALLAGLGSENVTVQRHSMATLGELLFYVASQEQQQRHHLAWSGAQQASGAMAQVLAGLVGDEVVRHYCAKGLENIYASPQGPIPTIFASPAFCTALMRLVADANASENTRATAASALCRLLKTKAALMPHFIDVAGPGLGLLVMGKWSMES
jgi:serine/threonine-protein kinase ULK4